MDIPAGMSEAAREIVNYFVSVAFFSSGRVAAFLTLASSPPNYELSHTAITQRAKAKGYRNDHKPCHPFFSNQSKSFLPELIFIGASILEAFILPLHLALVDDDLDSTLISVFNSFLWRSFASANLRNAVTKDINEYSTRGTAGFFTSSKQDLFALTPRAIALVKAAPDFQQV